MKITLLKTSKQNRQHLQSVPMETMIQTVMSNQVADDVEDLRQFVKWAESWKEYDWMYRLPFVYPSVEIEKDKEGILKTHRFTGLLTLSVSTLQDQEEAEEVKRIAAILPCTMAALLGSSGQTVKIIVRISRPNGSLPEGEDEMEQFCRQAVPVVLRLYESILPLAKTVPTKNKHWPLWFRTWFLAMVAQWLGMKRNYGNAMAPLLISKQGYNKSTFCKSLIPFDLQWGYTDSLILSEKKSVLQAMSQFLLINLDEFNQISPAVQQGFLKNVIQLAAVKVKRPYGKHVEDFPRLASFIATTNETDILADPTGNRRFMGIELTGPIDMSQKINYDQLYAQAVTLLEQGEPTWLDDKQTQILMESNRQFQLRSPEEMFFWECFRIPEHEEEGVYMSTAAILAVIKKKAGAAIRNGNILLLGKFLSNIEHLKKKRTNIGSEYLVIPLENT